MVWGTFLEKNFPSSNGHLLDFRGGLNPCPDGLGHFFRDEVPQSARLSAGQGMQKLFGQCPNKQSHIFGGASLTTNHHSGYMAENGKPKNHDKTDFATK